MRLLGSVRFDSDAGRCFARGPGSEVSLADQGGAVTRWLDQFRGNRDTSILLDAGSDQTGLPRASLEALLQLLHDERVLCTVGEVAAAAHRYGYNPQSGLAPLTLVEKQAAVVRRSIDPPGRAPRNLTVVERPSLLRELALRRRSARGFDGGEITEDGLVLLLATAYSGAVKATPSAGALYPCSAHAFVLAGDEWRLVEWEPRERRLYTLPHGFIPGSHSPVLRHALDSDDLVGSAAAFVIISVELSDLNAKYGNRGYRFAMLEAGQIGQMIHLAAVEQALGSHEWGAFRDRRLSELIGLDRAREIATVIALGRPCQGDRPTAGDTDSVRLRGWHESTPDPPLVVVSQEPRVRGRSAFLVVQQAEWGPRDVDVLSTGADWTTAGAYTRAMCEAIERRTSGRPPVVVRGTARDLPEGVMVAYDCLGAHDLPAFEDHAAFVPYDDDRSYEWVVGYRRSGAQVALPVELVATQVVANRPLCGRASSNGVAAGRTTADAEQSSFYELVERDAFVLCWINQAPPALWTSPPPWFAHTTSWTATGREKVTAHLFDAVLPTVGVAIRSDEWPALTFGMATRDNAEESLEKALQEAIASHAALAAMRHRPPTVPDVPSSPRGHALHYAVPAARAAVDWFFEGPAVHAAPAADWLAVDELADRLVHFEITQLDSPVHVVRTVSPDLRPIWFGVPFRDRQAETFPPHFFA